MRIRFKSVKGCPEPGFEANYPSRCGGRWGVSIGYANMGCIVLSKRQVKGLINFLQKSLREQAPRWDLECKRMMKE